MDQFTKLRQQIATLWMRLDRSQRTILTGLFILLVVIVLVSALWARTPDYAVAFGDVSEADAAQIVEQLREKDIPFRLGSNGSIMVPRAQVHEVRLDMAAQGLPKGGSIGMELFDSPGLGMTEFQEQVSFRRAMEGELARTITSLSSVSQARVHLVIPQRTLFRSEQVNPSASVLLNLAPGASLSQDQVRAIRFLVAAAVEGLAPEQVTIVDHAGNTLALGGDQSRQASMMEASAQQLQYQQAYERGLESRLQTMLEHLVGPGNVVVRAAVEMDWDQTETTSEIFSPGESDDEAAGVLRSAREQSERYSGSALPEGGVPGADANLPLEGGADVQEGEAHEGSYERSDVLYNYEVSRMAQHSISTPGRVKRLAISALVDGVEDEHALLNIERVLAAAVGMDPTRGDIIQVTGMPFDRSYADQELLAMEEARRTELYWTGAKVAAFIILIVIALIYLRSILNTLSPSRRWLVEEPSPRRLSRAGQ
ncbi:MAG TPA: flagellar M-ring protein FliF, partial [Chloroflexi bacterium]|nr:flagellar M-ring protein FliF [Chloroflexota bacterium]